MRILFGLFLMAHGLIHASYLSPAPAPTPGAPQWPFAMERSWLIAGLGIGVGPVRVVGTLLVVAVVFGFVLAGLAWLGIVVPQAWWPGIIVGSAAASTVLMTMFFHPWIVLGLVIDAVLVWLVVGGGWLAQPTP